MKKSLAQIKKDNLKAKRELSKKIKGLKPVTKKKGKK